MANSPKERKMNYLKIALILILFLIAFDLVAQCPMCKAAIESNMKDGGKAGQGINAGIMYLFLTPFALAATGIVVWKLFNRNFKPAEEEEMTHIEDRWSSSKTVS